MSVALAFLFHDILLNMPFPVQSSCNLQKIFLRCDIYAATFILRLLMKIRQDEIEVGANLRQKAAGPVREQSAAQLTVMRRRLTVARMLIWNVAVIISKLQSCLRERKVSRYLLSMNFSPA